MFGTQQDDLVLDFGGPGTWVLYDTGSTPLLVDGAITGQEPGQSDVRGFSDTRASIAGARAYAQLHTSSPEEMTVADIDASGRPDLILDFPGFGLWAWMNNAEWVQPCTR